MSLQTIKPKIKVFSDIKLQPKSHIIQSNSEVFPENPEFGQVIMVGGVVYYYGTLEPTDGIWEENYELSWIPTGNKILHYMGAIPTPVIDWSVVHNLGTQDLLVVAYDSTNKVIDINYTITNDNEINVMFSTPTTGRIVIFGASLKYGGGSGSGNITFATEEEVISGDIVNKAINPLRLKENNYNKTEVDTKISNLISQTAGNSTTITMSQKAVTDALNTKPNIVVSATEPTIKTEGLIWVKVI